MATFTCDDEKLEVRFASDAVGQEDLEKAARDALLQQNPERHALIVAILMLSTIDVRTIAIKEDV